MYVNREREKSDVGVKRKEGRERGRACEEGGMGRGKLEILEILRAAASSRPDPNKDPSHLPVRSILSFSWARAATQDALATGR